MLLALPMLGLVACHDDNDIPDVDFNFTFENATRVNGRLYVVQGDTMEIKSIDVINKEPGKPAIITGANYYWDYRYIGSSIQPPYAFDIAVGKTVPTGQHLLEIECPLFAKDKAAATALVNFRVEIVANADDIPGKGEQTFSVRPSTSADN